MGKDLQPRYDSRASFYGKASTRFEGNKEILTSYSTDVAYITDNGAKAVVLGDYSPTTLRHIKEFLKQNNFKAESKKQILKDYVAKEYCDKCSMDMEYDVGGNCIVCGERIE